MSGIYCLPERKKSFGNHKLANGMQSFFNLLTSICYQYMKTTAYCLASMRRFGKTQGYMDLLAEKSYSQRNTMSVLVNHALLIVSGNQATRVRYYFINPANSCVGYLNLI